MKGKDDEGRPEGGCKKRVTNPIDGSIRDKCEDYDPSCGQQSEGLHGAKSTAEGDETDAAGRGEEEYEAT